MFNDKLWKGGPYLQRSRGMSHPSHMILCPYLILRQMGKKLLKSGHKLKDLPIKQKLVKIDRFRHENIVAPAIKFLRHFFTLSICVSKYMFGLENSNGNDMRNFRKISSLGSVSYTTFLLKFHLYVGIQCASCS